jgi:hypothetical protein
MRRILLTILLGVGLGILLLEMGLRFLVIGRVVALPHPLYLLSRIPDSEGKWISAKGEFNQVIHFNSLGLRGHEPSLNRHHRYLVLGDSMIEALQVREEETLCQLLQEGLGNECTVVNAGMGGYSPLLMRLRLPELLEQIHPQMVLVGLFPNDLEEEHRYWRQAELDENGSPHAVVCQVFQSTLGRLDDTLFRHMALWRLLHLPEPLNQLDSIPDRQGEPPEGVIYPFRKHWTDPEEEAWSEISKSMAEIERLCHLAEARLHILLIPPGNQVSPEAWKTGKRMMGFGPDDWISTATFQEEAMARTHRIGIPATDLLPPFRAHPNPGTLYFDTDGHWTPAGHQWAAQTLLKDASIEWLAP